MSPLPFLLDSVAGDPFVAFSDRFDDRPPLRLLIFADRHGPSAEINFLCSLARFRHAGVAALRVIDEAGLAALRKQHGDAAVGDFLRRQFAECQPSCVILSRYCGSEYPAVFAAARGARIPVICHLDDNLLDPSILLGIEVWRRLKHPRRLNALYEIVENADLVYASTTALADAVRRRCTVRRLFSGVSCVGGDADRSAAPAKFDGIPDKQPSEIRIGYMGSASHRSDLEMVAPAILVVMRRFPQATFYLFGSVAATGVAKLFRERTVFLSRVKGNYADFREVLGGLDWDIGLAPLRRIEFNECKTPTKCIEYLEAGIAPIASDSDVYRPLADRGAVLLARPDEWANVMTRLMSDAPRRQTLVARGRELLTGDYSWQRLERQLLDVLVMAEVPLLGAA